MSRNKEHRGAAFGGRPIGCVFFVSAHLFFHIMNIYGYSCGCTPGLAHRNDYGLKVRGAGLCRVMGRGVHPFLPLLCFPSSFVSLLFLLSSFL